MTQYDIHMMGKPRMTQRDKWLNPPRKAVARYWELKNKIQENGVTYNENQHITFILPMPKSWSKKKKSEHNGKPHRQKPDLDNLIKSLWDCLFKDDAHFAKVSAVKLWGYDPLLIIDNKENTQSKGLE